MSIRVVHERRLALSCACCLVGLIGGCLVTFAAAQEQAEPPTTAAPVYRVGDTWTFSVVAGDAQTGDTIVKTVTAVTDEQTTMSGSKNGGPPFEVDLNSQGDMFRAGHTTWEPCMGWLTFPMAVGKSWSFHDIKRTSPGIYDIEEVVKVVSFERVQVPAGTFDAYKIVVYGTGAKHLGGGLAAQIHSTYWYAPSAKMIVKLDSGWTNYHSNGSEITQLTAYSLAP